jgi:hypothetical protein
VVSLRFLELSDSKIIHCLERDLLRRLTAPISAFTIPALAVHQADLGVHDGGAVQDAPTRRSRSPDAYSVSLPAVKVWTLAR